MPRYDVIGTIDKFPVRGTIGAFGQDNFLRLGAAWLRENDIELDSKVLVKLPIEDGIQAS